MSDAAVVRLLELSLPSDEEDPIQSEDEFSSSCGFRSNGGSDVFLYEFPIFYEIVF